MGLLLEHQSITVRIRAVDCGHTPCLRAGVDGAGSARAGAGAGIAAVFAGRAAGAAGGAAGTGGAAVTADSGTGWESWAGLSELSMEAKNAASISTSTGPSATG